MKLLRKGDDGGVQIIDAVNVQKTLSLFPDAVEMSGDFPDEFFRGVWELSGNMISVDLVKAKDFCHEKRRAIRDSLFEPHDKKISAQIPNLDISLIESQRQSIRDSDAVVQADIDVATDTMQLKSIIEAYTQLSEGK